MKWVDATKNAFLTGKINNFVIKNVLEKVWYILKYLGFGAKNDQITVN